jgi:hypothetical protein
MYGGGPPPIYGGGGPPTSGGGGGKPPHDATHAFMPHSHCAISHWKAPSHHPAQLSSWQGARQYVSWMPAESLHCCSPGS